METAFAAIIFIGRPCFGSPLEDHALAAFIPERAHIFGRTICTNFLPSCVRCESQMWSKAIFTFYANICQPTRENHRHRKIKHDADDARGTRKTTAMPKTNIWMKSNKKEKYLCGKLKRWVAVRKSLCTFSANKYGRTGIHDVMHM